MNKNRSHAFILAASIMAHMHIYAEEHLFNEDGTPSPALSQLLSIMKVEHDNTMHSIVQATQDKWLRKSGLERGHLQSSAVSVNIMPLLKKLGCIDDIEPRKKEYDYVLILGSTHERMNMRIANLIKQVNKGLKIHKNIILLAGKRYLDNALDDPLTYPNDLKTETDLGRYLLQNSSLEKQLKERIVIVDAPSKRNDKGEEVRPTTADTVRAWLMQEKPDKASCLSISSQPFVHYQDAVIKALLPENLELETIGNKNDMNLAVHLDNIARWIYQEQQMSVKNKAK